MKPWIQKSIDTAVKAMRDLWKLSLIEIQRKEKEKLNKLANEALRKGIPFTQDEKFMAQNRKVDLWNVNHNVARAVLQGKTT